MHSTKLIRPSYIDGSVKAPPSKSMTIRALIAASLAKGTSTIQNPAKCDDTKAALKIIEALGAKAKEKGDKIIIEGGGKPSESVLYCMESGLCMRIAPALAALHDRKFMITGSGSLSYRPIDMVVEPLKMAGAQCEIDKNSTKIHVEGPLKGGDITVDGSMTSQVVTGLLMTLPLVDKNSTITVKNPTSIPYIAMTIALLKKYGIKITHDDTYENFKIKGKQKYKPCTYNIEGDWSAAAPMLVAGAIRGKTFVSGVDILSEQADKEILSVLKDAGAYVDLRDDGIAVEKRDLKAFEFDVTNHPDLLPPLVALACYCQGQTEITGIERLRYKESDRVQALATELSRLGAYISCEDNSMIITGKALTGGFADANNDHRIAMALAIAALRAQGDVFIEGWKSVAKSYPNFFQHLEAISE